MSGTNAPLDEAAQLGPALARTIDAITQLGRKLDLSIATCSVAAHQLSICFHDRAGEALTVSIEAVRPNASYYQRGDRLGMWYASEEGAPVPAWLSSVVSELARLMPSLPQEALAAELAGWRDRTDEPLRHGSGQAQQRTEREVVSGQPQSADARPPGLATYTTTGGYVGFVPASPRHVLRKLLRPVYARYVHTLLSRYLPASACEADTVLDAMCGRDLPHLMTIRRHFPRARTVSGTDIDIDVRREPPRGTSVFHSDLRTRWSPPERYELITVFKPPTGALGEHWDTVFANLAGALQPGGHLFIVFGTMDQIDVITAHLRGLGVSIVTSEANAVTTVLEREHVWILVCRAPGDPGPPH